MPVDGTWRIQSASGLVTGTTTGFTATLPNPTADGSTLLLFIGASGSGSSIVPQLQTFDPPWFQDQAHAGQWYAWRRDYQPAGETSWAITQQSAISANFYWRAEEWSGLSTTGQPDSSAGISGPTPGVLLLGTDTNDTCTADVADFAALAVFYASYAGASGWPAAHSYGAGKFAGPSSWAEVDWLVNGDGTHTSDFILAIAEAYPGTAGDVGCTLTFDISGGGGTPASLDAWGVCYQPDVPAPALGIVAL